MATPFGPRAMRLELSALPEIVEVAHRVAWRKSPAELLRDPMQYLAHVMTFGEIEDVFVTRKYFRDSQLRRVLKHAPAGTFDPWSWNYWHVILNGYAAPAMPDRWFGFKRIRKTGKRLVTAAEIKCAGIPRFPRPEEIKG